MNRYTKNFNDFSDKKLIIVDVQEPFKEFFPENYIDKLNQLSQTMQEVFQVWDSNENGKINYKFPNQAATIEKKFGGKPNFNDLTTEAQQEFQKDNKKEFYFNTDGNTKIYQQNDGTILTYVGMGGHSPGHEWFIIPKQLISLAQYLKKSNSAIYIVGGANQECLYDIEIALTNLGVNFTKLNNYTYSANPV